MSINKEFKKKVNAEWMIAFKELKNYSPTRLLKIAGPIAVGLDIVPMPYMHVEYRPHIECFGLWEDTIQDCFKYPTISGQFYDRRNCQLNIKYTIHEDENSRNKFLDAVALIREQSNIPFEGNVTLTQLFNELDRYTATELLNYGMHIGVFEMKVKSAIYLGKTDLAQTVLNEVSEITSSWDASRYQIYIGKREDWLERLNNEIVNPSNLVAKTNNNLANPKLKNLHRSALIAD